MAHRSKQRATADSTGHRAVSDAAATTTLSASQRASLLDGLSPTVTALGAIVVEVDELHVGDLPITVAGDTIGGLRMIGIQGALDRLIDQIERELGRPVEELDRAGKQAVVRRLDELGAFHLRKAVEDIADRIHVSRFTVYNYLNRHP